MIGKIERAKLRDVWSHETEFTRWLEDNIDVLNDCLDLSLSSAEREQSVGSFSVDLIAEDQSGNTVIIENQLERSDHDHLGKVITYLVGVEARAAVWIVSDPRPEHVSTITWLNQTSNESFYLVKLEAVRIGQSPHAPLLTLIVGPSEEGRQIGRTKGEIAEEHSIRWRFWSELLERATSLTRLHSNITPGELSWISTGAGRFGLNYNYYVRQHDAQVELYIDRGAGRDDENKAVYDQLAARRDAIESIFGEPLEWQRLDTRRACRIRKVVTLGGYRDEESWSAIHEQMIDAMVRLERALAPHVAKLDI